MKLQYQIDGTENGTGSFFSMSLTHQLVFLVYAQPCHQLHSSKNLEHIRVLVADICTSKYKRYYLASVIARKVELKAMAPTHCSFSVSGNSLEHLIGILRLHRTLNVGQVVVLEIAECTR